MRWVHAAALVAVLLASGVGTRAHAQTAPVDDPRLASVRDRLVAAVRAADGAGLPSDWIVLKIREGLAKRAHPERIALAAELVLSRMRDAQPIGRLMPATSRQDDRRAILRALLDALAAGAPPGELGSLVRAIVAADPAHAQRDVLRGLAVLTELSERGFGGAAATRATRVAHGRGGSGAWSGLLRSAVGISGGSSAERGQRLEQSARALGRDGDHGERGGASDGASHPADRGGPPHDDAFDQGRGRGSGGRGRAP